MNTAVPSVTYPAAGVMAARPAIEPVRSPTNFGFFSNIHASTSHVIAANDAATSVLRNAFDVTGSTFNSLPALKPYQPNQRRPVPRATSGILWSPASGLRRLPT